MPGCATAGSLAITCGWSGGRVYFWQSPWRGFDEVSTAREDRALRVNDVRRGTRELLARIRQERIARADKTVRAAVEEPRHEEPGPGAGLMPDPLITRLSEQLITNEPAGVSPTAPASRPQRAEPVLQPQQAASANPPEPSVPGRITRYYDSARLGISPLNKDDAILRLDLSVSRSSRGSASVQQRFAQLAGLQPFERKRYFSPTLL